MDQHAIALEGDDEQELLESFHTGVAQIQSDAMQKITQAQVSGDTTTVISLSQQLQEQIQGFSELYAERIQALHSGGNIDGNTEPTSPYNFDCTIDLDLAVYDGDRDGYVDFESDPNVQKSQQEMEGHFGQYNSRKQLLKTSLKLTPTMAPNIYSIGDRCKDILGMNSKLEFYVYQDDRFNASVYPPSDDRIYIILSSGLLERFKDDEICFVIGHELGHTLFNHHKYPASHIMDFGKDLLSPMHAIKLFSWGRAAEISADRVGLICCQEFTAAARAFFKLSSGVTSDSLEFQLDEYVKQFVDLSAEMAGEQMDPEDWYSTHPFSPLRIKALEIFNRSETYHQLSGGNPEFSMTEYEMEQEIAQFMSLMEPTHLDQNAEVGGDIQRFLFLSGYLIAMADGTVDDAEIQALGRIVNKQVFAECIQSVASANADDIRAEITDLVDKLSTYLSPMQKLNIIRDLCLIASADGEIHDNELDVLYNLCYMQNIHPDFADQVLHDSRSDLD